MAERPRFTHAGSLARPGGFSTSCRPRRSSRAPSSRASWRDSTAPRTTAAPSSSRSIASTCPATSCGTSTGSIFARSNRLVVKEFIEETNLSTATSWSTASESMAFGSLRAGAQVRLRPLVRRGARAPRDPPARLGRPGRLRRDVTAPRSRPKSGLHQQEASILSGARGRASPGQRPSVRRGPGSWLASASAAPRHRRDLLRLLRRARRDRRGHAPPDPRRARADPVPDPRPPGDDCSTTTRLLRLDGLEGSGRDQGRPEVDPRRLPRGDRQAPPGHATERRPRAYSAVDCVLLDHDRRRPWTSCYPPTSRAAPARAATRSTGDCRLFQGFVHPAAGGFGALLAAVPLIIHLLNRQRHKPLEWAAMRFVLAAYKKTRRRAQLENLLLLLPAHGGRGAARLRARATVHRARTARWPR